MENYNHIQLTEEETNDALLMARKNKDSIIKQKEYWERIKKESEPIILNSKKADNWIKVKFKYQYGQDIIIDENNKDIIFNMCKYFTNETGILELENGIMLSGGVGCGKTTLMKLFNDNPKNSFIVVSCRKVAQEFANGGQDNKGGFKAIEKYFNKIYGTRNRFGHNEYGICFDDLGTESEKKNFGNNLNVMAEILLNRYDNQLLKGMTHITTNLTADEIEQYYGTRIRSRMREMFNGIYFSKESDDRRK